MSLRVNTNLASLSAQRHLNAVGVRLQEGYSRLSSGLRIARAADGASELGISERMRARIRSLDAASRNAMDGISMLQTAEGGLNEISNILVRMRELSVQAASGTLATPERQTLNVEFQGLKLEIDRLAKMKYNGIKILNNTYVHNMQVGTDFGEWIGIAMVDARTVGLGISTNGIGTVANASASMGALDSAIERVAEYRGTRGAYVNRLEHVRQNILTSRENLSSAESQIRDADLGFETAELARNTIIQQAATAVLAQANVQGARALELLDRLSG